MGILLALFFNYQKVMGIPLRNHVKNNKLMYFFKTYLFSQFLVYLQAAFDFLIKNTKNVPLQLAVRFAIHFYQIFFTMSAEMTIVE